ncbi:DUF732 domain-containing protein [Nocardia sp. 004]|uniref:DUF732 domain-containing protein n=1 Tax=Nocardia sp. 004 TaxID=3385978 RepID=UPI0039A3407D
MHRTRGKVFGMAAAIAAISLLAACGDNDSTATSTPTPTHTATATTSSAAAAPAEPGQAADQPAPAPAPEPEPEQSAQVPPERPQPVPNEAAPSVDTSKYSDKDRRFLDELAAQGIEPSTPDIALSVGAYVCQGTAAGASDEDLTTFVNAMAGSDPAFDQEKMSVEKAGQIYISTARAIYCQ